MTDNYQVVPTTSYSAVVNFNPKVLVVNSSYTVRNDEDTGFTGYWALDNYVKNLKIWQTGPITYTVNAIYTGTWCTFAGAQSPQSGSTEPKDGCGMLNGGYDAQLVTYASFNSLAINNGNIGTFNYGGSKADIVKDTYSNQAGNLNSSFDWINYYFSGANEHNFTYNNNGNAWSWTYANSTYPGWDSWVNAGSGSSGDITTPLIKVTYQVRNDSDSGNSGYWGLMTIHKLYHLAGKRSRYQVNATDVGTSCKFAGDPSPNVGTSQVANGCVSMVGGYDGNFTTLITPFNTSASTIGNGILLFGGTKVGILANTPTDVMDAYNSWIQYFFPGTSD